MIYDLVNLEVYAVNRWEDGIRFNPTGEVVSAFEDEEAIRVAKRFCPAPILQLRGERTNQRSEK